MSDCWPDEVEAEKRRRAVAAEGCNHEMVEYTGTRRRGWPYLWTKPDLICLKCGWTNDSGW